MTNELAIYDAKTIDALADALQSGKEVALPETDPEEVARGIVQRTLNAESFSDAFGPQTIPGWGDDEHLGRPYVVASVRFQKSTVKRDKGSPSFYAIVDVVDVQNGGVIYTLSCGGRNVLAQLIWLLRNPGHSEVPFKMVSKTTGDGNTVLWLEPA